MTESVPRHNSFNLHHGLRVLAAVIGLAILPVRGLAQSPDGPPLSETQQPTAYTLQSSIDYALAHRFNLASARSAVSAAQSAVTVSRALHRPNLSLGVSAIDILQHQAPLLLEDVLIAEEEPADNFYSARLTLSIPLFVEGGLVFRTLPSEKIAQAGLQSQQESYQLTREEVIYNVSLAFFAVLEGDQAVSFQEKALKVAEAQFRLAQERYDRDMTTRNELLTVQIELTTNRKDLTVAQNNQAVARFNLAVQMGLDPTEPWRVVPSAPPLPDLPPLEELIKKARQLRQDIALQVAAVEAARGGLELSKSARFPTLNLSSSYKILDDYQAPLFSKTWQAVLSITVPIWDFGVKGADISEKSYSLKAAEQTLQEVKNLATQEIQGLYTVIKNQEAARSLLAQQLEQAEEVLRLAEEKYRQNLASEVTVLAAQQAKLAAQKARITAEYDRQINYALLRKAVGGKGAF